MDLLLVWINIWLFIAIATGGGDIFVLFFSMLKLLLLVKLSLKLSVKLLLFWLLIFDSGKTTGKGLIRFIAFFCDIFDIFDANGIA